MLRPTRPLTPKEQEEAVRIIGNLLQKVNRFAKTHSSGTSTPRARLHDGIVLNGALCEAEQYLETLTKTEKPRWTRTLLSNFRRMLKRTPNSPPSRAPSRSRRATLN